MKNIFDIFKKTFNLWQLHDSETFFFRTILSVKLEQHCFGDNYYTNHITKFQQYRMKP